MSTNDLVILNQILDKQRQEFEPSLNPAQYFEIFVSELLLRGYADLNDDEVGSGVVAGPADGGIDSVYLFVNGLLIQEDTVLPDFKKNISVELVVIQAKTESTFAETPVDKLAITTNELLDFGKDLSTLTAVYNQDLINIAQRFMDTYKSLAVKRPSLSVQFYYVSKGEEVHPNVSRKGAILERSIADRFPNTTCTCHFIGARELLTLAYKTPPQTLELPCSEVLPVGNTGYICTVERRDYIKFITDDKNQLLTSKRK